MQRRGLVGTHCHHSILCRRSREAPAAKSASLSRRYTNIFLPYLAFESDSCVNIIIV